MRDCPRTDPSPPVVRPASLPGTYLRSKACRRTPLARPPRGSGTSNSSRRESLSAAYTRCQPRRTPEGRGTYRGHGHGGLYRSWAPIPSLLSPQSQLTDRKPS